MEAFVASAPARANIIGEHTDYSPNGGHVFPTPLPLLTTVRVETLPGRAGEAVVSSSNFEEPPQTRLLSGERTGHWSDYVVGCLRSVAAKTDLPRLNVQVTSNIPMGCGLGSSAALCVAVLRAVRGLLGANWIDEEVAVAAFNAEHDYAGVPCGPMDQFASSLGRPGQALLLDTQSLQSRNYRLDPKLALMLVDCGKNRDLKGEYHEKRLLRLAECTEARDRLGVRTLCELGLADLHLLSALPDNVARRAWHVVTENIRVLEFAAALQKGNLERQADLMEASHVSQRDNFECSLPEIDALVESSRRFGVCGARLVGGGFGGAIIALVPRQKTAAWWAFVKRENPASTLIATDESLDPQGRLAAAR